LSKIRRIWLAVILIPALLAAGVLGWWWQSKVRNGRYRDLLPAFYVMGVLKLSYYQPVNLDALLNAYWKTGNITGMLKVLSDPYTRYLDRNAYAELKKETQGSFGGIGVYLIPKADQLIISTVVKGSPGAKAGLQQGDRITKVGDQWVKDLSAEVAIAKIRGPAGSAVDLQISRGEGQDRRELSFRIMRENILIPTVEMTTKADPVLGKIGFIKISQFAETTPADLAGKLAEIDRDAAYRGLVLDLRANPGGSLEAAHKVASHFIPAGAPVLHIQRRGYPEESLPAEDYRHRRLPMVVLVDSWSASASEIVAGAIKDQKRATLVGTHTFGKDLIQEVKELPGETAITVTIASYLTSGRVNIHKKGVQPDRLVEIPGAMDRLLKTGDTGLFQEMQRRQEAEAVRILREEDGGSRNKAA
jgi:carboxyl-terminal processing protease